MPLVDRALVSLPVLLLRARVAVAARFNKRLRQHGLTEQQFRILLSLSAEDFADMTQLARNCDLLPSSVSRILTNLDARKLIVRTPDRGDARRMLTILCPAGRKLVETVLNDIQGVHADIIDRIGKTDARRLEVGLTSLIGALAEDPDDQGPDEEPGTPA